MLKNKVEKAIKLISKETNNKYRTVVAFSGGKNSLVALHLTIQAIGNPVVVFNNTTNEFPENLRYVRDLMEEWDLEFYELKPKMTWLQCVRKYGFPHISRQKYGEPPCCYFLKTEPMYRFLLDQWNIRNIITGLSQYESLSRFKLACTLGKVYETYELGRFKFTKRNRLPYKVKKIHPVLDWKEKEIWDYIEEYGLPVNPVYKKYGISRFGCMICTGHDKWEEQLAKINPRILRWVLKQLGQTNLFEYDRF